MKSNISAASNVYMSREDIPFRDFDYAAQIQDYERVVALARRKDYDYKVASLTKKQETILEIGMRCIYAKNDPCFGYVDEKHSSKCACINEKCPNIMKCNPNYSRKDAKFWTTTKEDRLLYGDPCKMREYYIVDIVSDEEMLKYECNPYNEGIEFSLIPEPVEKEEKKEKTKRTKIDPVTGRKMIVVGYKWMITDNASYENEELIPIWGFADEVEEIKPQQAMRKRAKRIEKLNTIKKTKKKIITEDGYENKKEYEDIVKNKALEKIGLVDVDDAENLGEKSLVICDNPAELAFISGGLVKSCIEHGYSSENNIRLVVIDELKNYEVRNHVYVTSGVIEKGCTNERYSQWQYLSEQSELTVFSLSRRSYVGFEFDGHIRWCCQNMYGITHVCISEMDFDNMDALEDGVCDICLILNKEKSSYNIENLSGKVIGNVSMDFMSDINIFKEKNEICDLPVQINGVQISVNNSKVTIFGIGHLEFDSY